MKYPKLLFILFLVAFTGCSAVNNEVESLNEEDIQVATQIIGESVSDDNSGVMASMYDALSDVDENGISYRDNQMMKNHDDHRRNGRGHERDFTHTYDPETGIHTISFERSAEGDHFSHEVSVLNKYIFTDPDGNFIARPKQNRDSVEAILFMGERSGSHTGPGRNSEFSRIDTMDLKGLHSTSSLLTLTGDHYGNGTGSVQNDRVDASRSYRLHVSFDDITINKAVVAENGNLEEGVTGTVTYSMYMVRTHGDEADEKLVEGEIEFEGDGTALLRYKNLQRVFRIFLDSGDVDEES